MGADLPLEVVAHSWFADEHYRIPQHSWYGYQGTKTESQWVGAPGGITGPLFPALSLTGGARCQHVLRLASLVKNSLTGQRGKDGETNSLSSSLQADFTHPICDIGDVSPQECPPLWFGTWGWIHFSTPHIVDILKMQRSPQNAGRILHLLKVCHHIPKIPPCCEMAFMKHFFQNIS